MELISVIIPIFNAEKYLRDCLESVLSQTYQNLEVFLIDDGSDDLSGKICEEYARNDTRVVYVHHDHEGVSFARNYGIGAAKGDWIAFVDADDALEPKALETLISAVDGDDIVCCSCKVIDDQRIIQNHFFPENKVFADDKDDLFLQLLDSNHLQKGRVYTAIGTPWGKLYNRKFLENNRLLFDTDLVRAQDNVFNMYAFGYAGQVRYIDKCLYLYRCAHISGFAGKYNKSWYNWLVALQSARDAALRKLNLIGNEKINRAYAGATIDNLVYLMRIGVFNKENHETFMDKVIKADRAVNMPCFAVYDDCVLKKKRVKTRLYYSLIKHRRYKLLNLIARMI